MRYKFPAHRTGGLSCDGLVEHRVPHHRREILTKVVKDWGLQMIELDAEVRVRCAIDDDDGKWMARRWRRRGQARRVGGLVTGIEQYNIIEFKRGKVAEGIEPCCTVRESR